MKNKITKKIFSLVLSLLMISMSFSLAFSLSAEEVMAVSWGTCEETTDGRYCVEMTESEAVDLCSGIFHHYKTPSQVPGQRCKPGVCVPPDTLAETCQAQKTKTECELGTGGRWYDASDVREVSDCQIGACSFAGTCTTKEKHECFVLAGILEYEFEPCQNQQSVGICNTEVMQLCAGQKRGCCIYNNIYEEMTEHSCAQLNGQFFELLCSEVYGGPISQFKVSCGVSPGTEDKICWFDSQGNQELCIGEGISSITDPLTQTTYNNNCDFPRYSCKICNEEECDDYVNNNERQVPLGAPYCKKIFCDNFTGYRGSQEIILNLDNHKREIEKIEPPTELRHGEQTCYNFYGSFERDDVPSEEIEEMYGKSTGLQNQVLECYEGELRTRGVDPTRNILCEPEFSTSGLRYAKQDIPNMWQNCSACGRDGGLNFAGDLFGQSYIFGGFLNRLISDHCTEEICENIGDCWFDKDVNRLVFGIGAAPVGHCVPLYPPAVSAGEAGSCGGGGDSLWNVCSEQECYSLGNYEFKNHGIGKVFIGLISGIGAYGVSRITVIPVECVFVALRTPGFLFFDAYWTCLQLKFTAKTPALKWAAKGMGWLSGWEALKWATGKFKVSCNSYPGKESCERANCEWTGNNCVKK